MTVFEGFFGIFAVFFVFVYNKSCPLDKSRSGEQVTSRAWGFDYFIGVLL